MPDAPIVSRPYHAKMCCERCAFGRGEHATWCRVVATEAYWGEFEAQRNQRLVEVIAKTTPPTASPWEDPWAKRKE